MIDNAKSLNIKEAEAGTTINSFCDYWEILVIKKGKATVVSGRKVYRLCNCSAAFFAPNEFHNVIADKNCEYITIRFSGTGELLSLLDEKVVYLNEEINLIVKANLLIENEGTLSLKQGFTMLELFLLLCCEKENVSDNTPKNAKLFTRAAEILYDNISSNLSINDLADELNVSASNLKRIFINIAGVGVHEYYTFIRIAKAKLLLNEGNSVTETAELTGFANQAYFSAAFKRVTGSSPKEYAIRKGERLNNRIKNKVIRKKDSALPSYLL